MNQSKTFISIPDEIVMNMIYVIRGLKVMLDRDLAELYGLETKRLKEAVRRNIERFPEDFMFELSKEEFSNWRTQFATSKADRIGLRIPPFAFTEHGALMLASVLNSERAIQVNIQIVRIFIGLREMISQQADIEKINKKLLDHENKIISIIEYLGKYEKLKQETKEFKNRSRIGFKQNR